jgi:hypothetical protein
MCEFCCGHRDKSEEKQEECSQEQIKECHDDTNDHPCEDEEQRRTL